MKKRIFLVVMALSCVTAGAMIMSACGKKQSASTDESVLQETASSSENIPALSAESVADSSDLNSTSEQKKTNSLSADSSQDSSNHSSAETDSSDTGNSGQQDSSQYTGQQMEGETEATSEEIEENTPTTSGENDIIFPDSSSEYISENEISSLSDSQKQKAINEIYARHGYDFPDSATKEYYEDFDWYTPTETDKSEVESSFNDYEKANVEALQK